MKTAKKPKLNINQIAAFLKWYKKQPFNQKASLLVAALVVLVLPLAVANVQNAIRERSEASNTEVTCETGRLTEDFSGSELDLTKYATSGAVIQQDDQVTLTAIEDDNSVLATKKTYTGDFYAEIDFIELTSTPATGSGYQYLRIISEKGQASIRTKGSSNKVESFAMIDEAYTTIEKTTNNVTLPIRVKVERKGTQIATYYKKNNESYQQVANIATKLDTPVTIDFLAATAGDTASTSATFDNFYVRCNDAPQSGASPTPTPTPDLRCKDQAPQSTPDLYQINLSNSKATLYFTPAKAPIGRYVIEFGENGQMQHSTSVDSPGTSGAVSATVNALKPNTTYTFRVQPINGCQPGSWSNNLNGTTTRTTTQNRTAYKDGQSRIVDSNPPLVSPKPSGVGGTPEPTVKPTPKPLASPKPSGIGGSVKTITEDSPVAENPEYVAPKPLSWWERIVAWFVGLFS